MSTAHATVVMVVRRLWLTQWPQPLLSPALLLLPLRAAGLLCWRQRGPMRGSSMVQHVLEEVQ
jgi:hypothetical protein